MFSFFNSPRRQLAAAQRVLAHVAEHSDMPIAVRLWDGSVVALGDPASPLTVEVRGPGVIGSTPTSSFEAVHHALGAVSTQHPGGSFMRP